MADDYDFFDTPRQIDANLKDSEASERQSISPPTSESRPRNPTPSAGNNSTLHGKPPAHPNSAKKKNDYRNNRETSVSDSDDSSAHQKSTDRSRGSEKRVIEAKIPSAGKSSSDEYSSSDDNTFESNSDEEKHSARKSKGETKKENSYSKDIKDSRKNVKQASAHKDVKKSDKNHVNKKERIDVRLHIIDTESSDTDSDVTNVSPLNTPHPARSASAKRNGKRVTVSDVDEIPMSDLNELLQTVLDMDRGSGNVMGPRAKYPVGARKNYSFSKDTLREIDRENERLMHKILVQAVGTSNNKQRSRSYGAPGKMTATQAAMLASQSRRPTSAAINRQRELQRIDAENMLILRRLQQARPSRTLLAACGSSLLPSGGYRSTPGLWRTCISMSGSSANAGSRTRPQSSVSRRPVSGAGSWNKPRPVSAAVKKESRMEVTDYENEYDWD